MTKNISIKSKTPHADYYIAYGANMPTDAMAVRTPGAKLVGTGMVDGYRLAFNGCATVVPDKTSQVPVVIWTITDNDENSLDHFEGFPSYYRKEYMDVTLPDGSVGTGMIYIMNSHDWEVAPPSQGYYDTLARGYREHGLPLKHLTAALNESHNKKVHYGFAY